ncbi:MAG TPA: ATP synthase F1 subunit delta [Dehalococcoidia bacterium]|nr:ATP synthase F1 subunit delta [Dehalococcoidia bacterium]
MANELAAKRYAQAAFEVAREEGNLAAWSEALARIAHFLSDGDAARVLANTRVPQDVKHQLIEAGLGDLPRTALNLAHLLVNKGRTALARDIAAEFGRLVEEHQGVSRARAVTAVELTDADREALSQRLSESTGRRILLETEVDPSILGGVIVQIGDRLLDGSTKSKLEALRSTLVGAVR